MLKRIVSSFAAVSLVAISAFADDQVAMWQVKDKDTTINIIGTVHVLKPGTVWLNDDIKAALNASDKLILELSPDQSSPQIMQALVQSKAMLPAGQTLKDSLPEDEYGKLIAGFAALGLPEANVQQFKPWFAAVTYSAVQFLQYGYQPTSGVEAVLTGLAQAEGKPVDGLETAEFQLSVFDSLTDEQELAFVRSTLDGSEESAELMNNLTTEWLEGDADSLASLMNEGLEELPGLAESLLYKRNANWVEDVKGILAQEGNFMIAVGTGHLAGDRSLIDLLEKDGVEVSRVH